MLSLALLFQDHMILQRGKRIPIWGKARADSEVSVMVQGKTEICRARVEGCWYVEIGPLEIFRWESCIPTFPFSF